LTFGGGLELFKAKWPEVPSAGDVANINFVRGVMAKSLIASDGIIRLTLNGFPVIDGAALRCLRNWGR